MAQVNLPMGLGAMDFGNWLYGVFAAFIGGATGAFSGGLANIVVDGKDYNFDHPQKLLTVVAVTFFFSGLMTMFAYLHQNPLPAIRTVTTEVRSPHTTTVTTVTEEPK